MARETTSPSNRFLVGMLGCIPGACEINIDAPYVWTGDHVVVRSDMPLERWCEGFLPSMDAFVEHAKNIHGGPDDLRVTAYILEDPASAYGACRLDGCARGTTAYTHRGESLRHELVHTVRGARGNSPHFFEEGAATYWGGATTPWFSAPSEPNLSGRIVDTIESSRTGRMTASEYLHAAHFTGYLVHSYGIPASAAFAESVDDGASRRKTRNAFEAAFGVPLATAIEAYEQTWPSCGGEATQSAGFDCAGVALPIVCGDEPDERRHLIDVDVFCDEPEVTGPWYDWRSQDDWVSRTVVVELFEPGRHELSAYLYDEVWDAHVTFKRCDTDCAKVEPLELFVHDPHKVDSGENVELEPGRYIFRISRPAEHPTTIQLDWRCRW